MSEYEDLEGRFIDALRIKDLPMRSGIAAETVIRVLYEDIYKVWEDPVLYKFVDHGLGHSYRVLRKSLELAKILTRTKPLCVYERVILGMAALLHDIGMQYGKYHPEEKLPWEEIRKQHCDLGMRMVNDSLKSGGSGVVPNFVQQGDPYREYLDEAAEIAFTHADPRKWQKLCARGFEERDKGIDAYLRPQLLAALLRFGDELDMSWERVSDINLLKVQNYLSPTEKAHWCACYYVNNTGIDSPESGGARIEIAWRIPKDASEPDSSAIRALISQFRLQKANEELRQVEKFLVPHGRAAPPVIKVSMSPNPVPERIDSPPQEVLEYIASIKRPSTKLSGQIRPLADADEVKRLALDFFETERPTMFQGHVALRTGWHTNAFLQCRTLVAKREFTVGLARAFSQNKEFKKAHFTDILAYGTSSIRIGSIVALALGAKLSYTFYEGDPSYMSYERSYNLSPGSRILIIDDILSIGTVANRLLKKVLETYKPERLDFFVIYLLGRQTKIDPEIERKVNIRYLVQIPTVSYYKEGPDGLCEDCRNDPGRLTREEDLLY